MEWYEILVKGHLDERRGQMFPGLTLNLLPDGDTRLSGPVLDQAALHGILSNIRDLGLPLLLVKKNNPPDPAQPREGE